MAKYISPREFLQTYQPHGDKAKLYINDTLNGSRFATVDRVDRQDSDYFLYIEGKRYRWDGYQELIIELNAVRTPSELHQPLFDWYLDSDFQQELIDYKPALQEHFEDSYERREITVNATLARLRNVCSSYQKDDLIADRLKLISDLASVMQSLDKGLYEDASIMIRDIQDQISILVQAGLNVDPSVVDEPSASSSQ